MRSVLRHERSRRGAERVGDGYARCVRFAAGYSSSRAGVTDATGMRGARFITRSVTTFAVVAGAAGMASIMFGSS